MSTALTILLAAFYVLAWAAILLFFEGAACANERWDRSNHALWESARRFHSEEQQAA